MIAVFASLSCVHAVPPTSETRLPAVLQLQGEAIHVTGSLWNLRIPTPCTSKRSMDEEQLPSQSNTLLTARFGEGWSLRLCLRLHKRLRIGSPRAHSCNGYSQATGSIWVNWQVNCYHQVHLWTERSTPWEANSFLQQLHAEQMARQLQWKQRLWESLRLWKFRIHEIFYDDFVMFCAFFGKLLRMVCP